MALSTANMTVWDIIERDIFERLRAINRNAGYNFTTGKAAVVGPYGDGFPFRKQNPNIGVVAGQEETQDDAGVIMRRCVRDVGIEAWVDIVKTGGDSEMSRAYQMIVADIEKALIGTATGTRHTRGGYAEDTEILTRKPVSSGNKKEVGAYVHIRVIYRHSPGDLYTRV